MCGEHSSSIIPLYLPTGSSPHVRGAPRGGQEERRADGIIPACAGSTARIRYRDSLKLGSSPHVRGALASVLHRRHDLGIIPACAGSTLVRCFSVTMSRDHPRMCGEHRTSSWSMKRLMGSSPHVRGAPHIVIVHETPDGIIPACAGSTLLRAFFWSLRRDHPRMCGEHMNVWFLKTDRPGSSPHVRGAPRGMRLQERPAGIIPACAGSTPWPAQTRSSRRDHPRMCGEH